MAKNPIHWGSLALVPQEPYTPKERDAYIAAEGNEVLLHVFHEGEWKQFHIETPKKSKSLYHPI